MSNRSMLEINHDRSPRSTDAELLAWAKEMKAYFSSGDPERLPNGVTYFGMRHHTQPCPLVKIDWTIPFSDRLQREIHYQWKELVDCDGVKRLLNVQRDPMQYENSIGDLIFDTPQKANEALDDYDCREQAKEDKWILVKVVYDPTTYQP